LLTSITVGISIAIWALITVIVGTIYHITKRNKASPHQIPRRRPAPLDAEASDSESNESDSSDDEGALSSRNLDDRPNYRDSSSTNSRFSIIAETSTDDDDKYSRFFGLRDFTLHTRIPFVRGLWKYHIYYDAEFDQFGSGLEPFGWDYPLSRWYKKYLRFIKLRGREDGSSIEYNREAALRRLQLNSNTHHGTWEKEEGRGVIESHPVLRHLWFGNGLRARRQIEESED
jgi:hypothetical protein